mmetsp:Transcript_23372/g.51340  ORF Transcript_23372/g.51340 Transcript_23372/m.51340 type:complete len:359 (+) Transcript_23372:88-1164(+)
MRSYSETLLPSSSSEEASERGAVSMRQRGFRRFFPLSGGEEDPIRGVVIAIVVLYLVIGSFIGRLDPNEYGLVRNSLAGTVSQQVYRGGLHMMNPFSGFIAFPATQSTILFGTSIGADRAPVTTRTGADPNDPDSGGQPIQISCAIQVEFVDYKLREVYYSFGSYEAAKQRVILLAGNVVGNTAQEFVPQDFWNRRDYIAEQMLRHINNTLWDNTYIKAMRFEMMRVDFAEKFEDSITAIQVAEQAKVVNEYEQQVQQVVQSIEVMRSKINANIANISAGAEAKAKELRAGAKRDAFALTQGMKAKKYAELKKRLGFNSAQLQEFFKAQLLQHQGKGSKVVIGMSGIGEATTKTKDEL